MQKYWLGFNHVKGIGPSRLRHILTYFHDDLEAAWKASPQDLLHAGIGEKALNFLLDYRRRANLDALLEQVHRLGATLCTWHDENYPPLLKTLEDSPPVLYIKGDLLPHDNRALAIVGTRKATNYGREVSKRMATALAKANITIVSGLALGIDTEAHQGALQSGGRTIAVMGNGIDRVYPVENERLAKAILENHQGAIITEYPIGTPPNPSHFPARNRIISGLSLGLLVVEAPKGSGALLTADAAMEQGRDVFAIPGNINLPNSRGTNALIQQGAKLVMHPEDILEDLNISYQHLQTAQVVQNIMPDTITNPVELELLQTIAREALHIDDIARQTSRTINEVSALLTLLELKGVVRDEGGMVYRLSEYIEPESLFSLSDDVE